MKGMYESAPGHWLMEGVTLEENERAWAANYTGPIDDDWTLDAEHPEDEEVWITKDGHRIPYASLEDGHLTNILRFLVKRHGDEVLAEFPKMVALAKTRGLDFS